MPLKILVTGGAGYIGSHTVRLMDSQDYEITVLDNLVYGHRESIVTNNVTLVVGDLSDQVLVNKLFTENKFDAVIHFAAYAYVGESVTDPAKYYMNNTAGPLVLLEAMKKYQCKYFIFSSTCATYGNPQYIPIDEDHPQNPINPYGRSKLMLEKILEDYDHAYGIKSVRLRYFNACGASLDAVIGEDHDPETHLIPLVLMAIKGERNDITVFGTDYDTPDGTCIRDYIHVNDLGRAHIQALSYLLENSQSLSCNLGTGQGVSVKEIIEKAEKVTGFKVPVIYGDRREGDPPELVANPKLAKEKLNWEAEFKDVSKSLETAWNWMNRNESL